MNPTLAGHGTKRNLRPGHGITRCVRHLLQMMEQQTNFDLVQAGLTAVFATRHLIADDGYQ
jgi:hypothetical protein